MQWPIIGALVRAAIAIAGGFLVTRFGYRAASFSRCGRHGDLRNPWSPEPDLGGLATALVVSFHEPRSRTATTNREEDMSRTKESRNKALVLEPLHPLQLRDAHPAVLRLPVEVGRTADPMLPGQLAECDSGFAFLQDRNDL